MLMPSIFGENLFDEFMGFPFDEMEREMNQMDRQMRRADRRLYGKNAAREMKTDVRETENGYEVEMDLPGFKKDQVQLELLNGYLTVTATKGMDKDEKNDKGKVIRQERYAGSLQRTFYVGEHVTENDVKAKFEDGVLHLELPKEPEKKMPEKKTIMIEG